MNPTYKSYHCWGYGINGRTVRFVEKQRWLKSISKRKF